MLEIKARQLINLQKMNNEQKDQNLHVSQHSSNEMLSAALSVEEGNKLIAEFLNIPKCQRCTCKCGNYQFGAGLFYHPKEMKYYTSWDWLMPVVQKIVTTSTKFNDVTRKAFLIKHMMFHEVIGNIEKLWERVVDYVIAYNNWVSEW